MHSSYPSPHLKHISVNCPPAVVLSDATRARYTEQTGKNQESCAAKLILSEVVLDS